MPPQQRLEIETARVLPDLGRAAARGPPLDGVGNARALERLCGENVVYQWIGGGVSVNHHTLGDFRAKQAAFVRAPARRRFAGSEVLKRELDDDPGATKRRQQAAKEQAAKDRAKRVTEALRQLRDTLCPRAQCRSRNRA